MDPDARACQHLMQSVVLQALVDACAPDNQSYSKYQPKRDVTRGETEDQWQARCERTMQLRAINANRHRTEARRWLLNDSDDFVLVCSMAGYNPQDIRERARKLADAGWPVRFKRTYFQRAA
jgi:hypothetical protein